MNPQSPALPATERFRAFAARAPLLRMDGLEEGQFAPQANTPEWGIAREGDSLRIPRQRLLLGLNIRNLNREMFHALEGTATSLAKAWNKQGPDGEHQGGGVMTLLRGRHLEKAAVNWSCVWGPSYPSIEKDYSGKPFTATGVSLICHPRNPHAPIAHMNVRILSVGMPGEQVTWMGGGADLTPMVRYPEDTELFHRALERVCVDHPGIADYPRFKAWCDEYFFIPHRKETRGVGGIFFDYLTLSGENDLQLLLDVGQAFARAYGEILSRRLDMPYSDQLVDEHLHWRGRYAEFNLAYDRGTRFGLLSGGNTEAIFASLPPVVKW